MNYTFESVIDACPLPIVRLDRDAKIQVWNRAAEIFFGWSSFVTFPPEPRVMPNHWASPGRYTRPNLFRRCRYRCFQK
jgi:PAS domain-containing protein